MLKSTDTLVLQAESATAAIGQQLVKAISSPLVIFLQGELAAGKTTLVRGFLQAMGHVGKVKSPTYTLVEEYYFEKFFVYHFDLYRLSDPEELEFMGIREYFTEQAVVLIEWPERGKGVLPDADLLLTLKVIPEGRLLSVQYLTEQGLALKPYFLKSSLKT